MAVVLLTAEHALGDTLSIITEVMNAAATRPFPKVEEPIIDDLAIFQHVLVAPKHLETLKREAKQRGCYVLTERFPQQRVI
jgi:hypothetical protein